MKFIQIALLVATACAQQSVLNNDKADLVNLIKNLKSQTASTQSSLAAEEAKLKSVEAHYHKPVIPIKTNP